MQNDAVASVSVSSGKAEISGMELMISGTNLCPKRNAPLRLPMSTAPVATGTGTGACTVGAASAGEVLGGCACRLETGDNLCVDTKRGALTLPRKPGFDSL